MLLLALAPALGAPADPLSLALPWPVHAQPYGSYVDVATLHRAFSVDLTLSPGGTPGMITLTHGDVVCEGEPLSGDWQTLTCAPPRSEQGCGTEFGLDARFARGVLHTRARQACVVDHNLWPAESSFVKVNALALSVRSNMGEHGGSETAGVLGGVLDWSLGPDQELVLRRYEVGAERALADLGLSPFGPPSDPLLASNVYGQVGDGVVIGAMSCASQGAQGDDAEAAEAVNACFLAEAERFGAIAVYGALHREQAILGDVCPPAPVEPDPGDLPIVSPAPDGGTTSGWDIEHDGTIDYEEHVDGAGRLTSALQRTFEHAADGGAGSWVLKPVFTRRYGAGGEVELEQADGYEFGHTGTTHRFTYDANGRVIHHEIDTRSDGGRQVDTYDATWGEDGRLQMIVHTDVGPHVSVTSTTTFVMGKDGEIQSRTEVARSDQTTPSSHTSTSGRVVDAVPKALRRPSPRPGPHALVVERDTAGRIVRLGAAGGYESTWAYPGDGTVTLSCTSPGERCRARTFHCAAPLKVRSE